MQAFQIDKALGL